MLETGKVGAVLPVMMYPRKKDRRFEVLVLVGLHGIDDVRVRALENVHQDDRR